MEFALPETAEVVSGRKNIKTTKKSVEKQTWENSWVVGAGNGVRAESFKENLQNKPVGRGETFPQTFLNNHVELFSVPSFVAVSGNLGGIVPLVDDGLSS